jgi:hypothetical protein
VHRFKNKTKVARRHNFVALKIVIASSCSVDLKMVLTREKGDRKKTAVKSILFDGDKPACEAGSNSCTPLHDSD